MSFIIAAVSTLLLVSGSIVVPPPMPKIVLITEAGVGLPSAFVVVPPLPFEPEDDELDEVLVSWEEDGSEVGLVSGEVDAVGVACAEVGLGGTEESNSGDISGEALGTLVGWLVCKVTSGVADKVGTGVGVLGGTGVVTSTTIGEEALEVPSVLVAVVVIV